MKKRFVSLLVAVVMLVCMAPSAMAAVVNAGVTSDSAARDEYAEEMARLYVSIKSESSLSQMYLSQGFEIKNSDDENKRIYFVFDQDKCIGQMIVTYLDGRFASNYTHMNIPTISDAYNKQEKFSLVTQGQTLWYQSEEKTIALQNYGGTNETTPPRSQRAINRVEAIMLHEVLVEVSAYSDRYGSDFGSSGAAAWGHLDVPFVANELSPDNVNVGLCWAASASSLVAYRKQTEPLTALEIYNELKANYNGIPAASWMDKIWTLYNVSVTEHSGGLLYDEVKGIIQDKKPIEVFIYSSNNILTAYAHSVVLCGYQEAQGGYRFYEYVDCNNMSGNTTLTEASNSSRNFEVINPGITYKVVGYTYY